VKDELGRRIKEFYEDALRVYLPRRSYVVIRIDGRGFHRFTKRLERPYSQALAACLDAAALALAEEMMGCRFGYGQSDEYSFLLTDWESEQSRMWFDGNVQKIVSVSASVFTAVFNREFFRTQSSSRAPAFAAFDARVLAIPRREECEKYFLWRQLDASANSLNMLASAHYSHEELLGKTVSDKHDLLHARGVNWNDEPAEFKRGRVVRPGEGTWRVDREPPIFTKDRAYLAGLIPE
jgi:tRNA(His) 5'-end guanylyltransferase